MYNHYYDLAVKDNVSIKVRKSDEDYFWVVFQVDGGYINLCVNQDQMALIKNVMGGVEIE